MKIEFSPPDISELEIEEVVDTLRNGWITTGPKTKKLEKLLKEYTDSNKVICLNSCTAAMEIALRLLEIGPGDEVITSAYTYTASASVIDHIGADIVLVDTEEDSYFMDYNQLEEKITERTKAIIPVDLAGVPVDYDKIFEIIEKKKSLFKAESNYQEKIGRIAIVADSAHSLGSTYKGKKTGSIADFSAFSFHAVKNFTTAEGGALSINHEKLDADKAYDDLQLLSLHGQNKDALSKMQLGSWEYDIVGPWYKYNMSDIMASIGLGQFKRYPKLLEKREEIIKQYDEAFKNTKVKTLNHYGKDYFSNGHLYLTRIEGIEEETRNRIIEEMAKRDIATNVHYKPLPMMTAYKNLGFKIEDYPNAFNQYKNGITLPLHTKLTKEEVDYVIENFLEIVNELS